MWQWHFLEKLYLKTPTWLQTSLFFVFSNVIFRFSQHLYDQALLASIHSGLHSCLNIQFLRTFLHLSKKWREDIYQSNRPISHPQQPVSEALSILIYATKSPNWNFVIFMLWTLARFTKWSQARQWALLLQQVCSAEHPQPCVWAVHLQHIHPSYRRILRHSIGSSLP